MKINNYLDLLIDKKIDNITKCPICVDGNSGILTRIYIDLKNNIKKGTFQKVIKNNKLTGIYIWKLDIYPIPITKIKQLLNLWKQTCQKTEQEYNDLYNNIFNQTTHFRVQKSPIKLKVIKQLTPELAYLIGVIYADGALRDCWKTLKKKKRFVYEISITDESNKNLSEIIKLLENIFNIKTNVKKTNTWYRILFTSSVLHRLLNKLFEMPLGYKKGKLKIPKVIKKSSLEIKKHFLIGFFDGDGMCSRVNKNKKFTSIVSISQSDKKILLELQEILKEFNLNFRLHRKTRGKFEWYTLNTKDKKQIVEFHNKIGFKYLNKKERLKELVQSFNPKNPSS